MSTSILYGDERITLDESGDWQPSSDRVVSLASLASILSRPPFYEYNPSHGAYGPLLASLIVERIGGKVEIDRDGCELEPEGIVF